MIDLNNPMVLLAVLIFGSICFIIIFAAMYSCKNHYDVFNVQAWSFYMRAEELDEKAPIYKKNEFQIDSNKLKIPEILSTV
ncbi:unnamed protein product [Caenorhabditis nigoni]